MATVESISNGTSRAAKSTPLLVGLWRRWQRKRRRDRARMLSQVRFRMTREGVHFVGILIFIFVGAVIRDINLLILLAGVMIGLLILQWRFNTSTLVGLQVQRRLPRHTSVDKNTEVDVLVQNPKHWLSAWLVLVEDPIQKNLPDSRRVSDQGMSLVDAVRPLGVSECRYRISFHERGKYEIGPSTISTRFPLGLGRGWRTVDNATEILVHPRQGKLLPAVTELFHEDRTGHSKASTHSGPHEGEFFGLRPWETGDSRRWIHWRTTARRAEITVRQFERRQQQQTTVLLDLFDPQRGEDYEHVESAVSFLATLARSTVSSGRDKLSVSVAGRETSLFETVQSAVLVNNLLDDLAVIRPSPQPDLGAAFQGLSMPLLNHPHLVVISTREDQTNRLKKELTGVLARRMLSRVRIRWINVSAGELEPYIQWT